MIQAKTMLHVLLGVAMVIMISFMSTRCSCDRITLQTKESTTPKAIVRVEHFETTPPNESDDVKEEEESNDDSEDSSGDDFRGLTHKTLVLLSPPYRIFQFGPMRTQSTFQFQILQAIVGLRDPKAKMGFLNLGKIERDLAGVIRSNVSFVFKTHKYPQMLRELAQNGTISAFSSGGDDTKYAQYALYSQGSLRGGCDTCEVRAYAPFFGLTDKEIGLLSEHMHLYTIIRQCCGHQMSKYEMLRLHGCNVTEYKYTPGYPRCETYNMTQVEEMFESTPVPYNETNPSRNWAKPGDCQRFSNDIREKKLGFNGRKFTGECTFEGLWGRG